MESWFWPLAILVMILVIAVFLRRELGESVRGEVTRHFRCPNARRDVVVRFRSDFLDPDYYEDVVVCSEFGEGEPVPCDKLCLCLSKREFARAEEATVGL